MTSPLQKSNSRVMQQKIEKALRLMGEVLDSIAVRDKPHPIWDKVITTTADSKKSAQAALNALDEVIAHNKAKDAEKI